MSKEIKAHVARDSKPTDVSDRPDAVRLRLAGAIELLVNNKPENVFIEIHLDGSEPKLANGNRLVCATQIMSSGTGGFE